MALPAIAAALGRTALAGAVGGGSSQAVSAATRLAFNLEKLLPKAATIAVNAIGTLASTISHGLLAPLAPIQQLFQSIGPLVKLFNPGIVTQFQLALNDTMAVIGSALVPVLQGMTIYVRKFGDALAGLLPALQPFFDGVAQFIANFATSFVPIIEAAAPFIAIFGQALADLMQHFSKAMALVHGIIAELINLIADLFGVRGLGGFNKDAKSTGFAARQTKVSGVEQFARDVFASTAKNIYARQGEGKTPTALLQEIKDAMAGGKQLVQEIRDWVKKIYEWFAQKAKIAEDIAAERAAGGTGGKAAGWHAAAELRRQQLKPP